LADKSKFPCFGVGVLQFLHWDESIILHDILHVPNVVVLYFLFIVFVGYKVAASFQPIMDVFHFSQISSTFG
jgi:hypothetical protein